MRLSPSFGACVFDAYGTLFDVNAAAHDCQAQLGEQWQPVAELWRVKQLQYSWLRAVSGRHADFWKVTGDALDFALSALGIEDTALRARLMDLYLVLGAYPEVPAVLRRLKEAGMKLAILSNGTPAMLAAAAANAGIADLLDAVLSVEEVQVYKPHPSVYQLACDRFALPADRICSGISVLASGTMPVYSKSPTFDPSGSVFPRREPFSPPQDAGFAWRKNPITGKLRLFSAFHKHLSEPHPLVA